MKNIRLMRYNLNWNVEEGLPDLVNPFQKLNDYLSSTWTHTISVGTNSLDIILSNYSRMEGTLFLERETKLIRTPLTADIIEIPVKPVYDGSSECWKLMFMISEGVWTTISGLRDDDQSIEGEMLRIKKGWRYRYFQGTDPIFSESGHSKMASAIWDSHHQTISAHVNFRVEDYRYCYLQTLLLGLYYDKI